MIREGIVLGHIISERGIKLDKAKVKIIEHYHLQPLLDKYDLFKVMLVFMGISSKILAKFQDPCTIYWPRIHRLSLMIIV